MDIDKLSDEEYVKMKKDMASHVWRHFCWTFIPISDKELEDIEWK